MMPAIPEKIKVSIMNKTTAERAAATLKNPRWQKVLARDTTADGTFYYAVRTTGVYCQPSCGARPARPENVVFYNSAQEAEAAGFRPCKRCRPDQPHLAERHRILVEQACRFIEQSSAAPTLTQIAAHVGMSEHHFHRLFKAATGLTPKAYITAQRQRVLKEHLGQQNKITDAIYAAGYGSSSRFYETAGQVLGMTPSDYKKGGQDTEIRFAIAECSLGSILVASSAKGVCAILMDDDPEFLLRDLQDRFPRSTLIGADAAYERLVAQVVGFVEAPQLGLDLPLDVRGTAFQQRVWQVLRNIPYGSTASYSEIAEKIGMPKAVRAVAQACRANALAVAIPCHRVVRTDGALSGYRWGVERKRRLLDKEAQARSQKNQQANQEESQPENCNE